MGVRLSTLYVCTALIIALLPLQNNDPPSLSASVDGRVVASAAQNGDVVPDFSSCGFEASNSVIPLVGTTFILHPSGGDDTAAIQQALDTAARRPLRKLSNHDQQWRGAVVLGPGIFRTSKTLRLSGDRIVLRGSGDGKSTTEIRALGKSRLPAVIVGGTTEFADQKSNETQTISSEISEYVSIGSTRIRLLSTANFVVGQTIEIVHPSTQKWIDALGMRSFPDDDAKGSWLNWKPTTMDQVWTRQIKAIEGNDVQLDAPITSSIDPELTKGIVRTVQATAQHHLGIENLKITSQADVTLNPLDEEHAWDGIRFDDVSDAFARNVTFEHFAGSAVLIAKNASRISVSDCRSMAPISEIAGWRRHTFFCCGQQSLFLRCTAEDGRHDFSTGPLTSGPNAFVNCSAKNATEFSGPLGSWSTGLLLDNVEIDGSSIELTNLETEKSGTGWAAANCIMWNCVAPKVVCRQPPTGINCAVGIWGEVVGNGSWKSLNEFVSPGSLFAAQLTARIGKSHSQAVLAQPPSNYFSSATIIEPDANSFESNKTNSVLTSESSAASRPTAKDQRLSVTNGWLTLGDSLATGKRQTLAWWRGSMIPARAQEFGAGLTRFVPGMDGLLFTNSVSELALQMKRRGAIALEHHWGLWYDRRRDDHQMIRRMNADVWPPFYEQPWARSGQGKAWDGLSKYDLTRFNSWYFSRLAEFANLADQQGLILIQQMYFQHNILEAGAHWADFPWRSANCIQDVGFPEPPVYENRKRVFMADDFYDVDHPVRRDLHTRYIRHCLDTLGHHTNVLFEVGEEYSGPAHFVRFWLDCVKTWSQENNRDVKIVLSTCRDVQEEILSVPEYAAMIDVIDLKYWWLTKDGQRYDPPGGKNLAPRQQLRTWTGSSSRSSESLCRSIRELKSRFPEKAVICSLPSDDPWKLVAAGCSLAELPASTDETLLREIVRLRPATDETEWALRREGSPKLIVESDVDRVAKTIGPVLVVDSKTGRLHKFDDLDLPNNSGNNNCVLWIVGTN